MLALFTLRLMLANIRRRISADSLTDLNPWIPRDAALSNVTRLRICCMSLASCSESGTESTEKSASVHHCVRCASAPGSTLGTLERCQQPLPVNYSEVVLAMDAFSEWDEGTVT